MNDAPQGGRRPLMLYSGNEGSRAGLAEIRARKMGVMVTAAQWRSPKPGIPWALDNGAYSSWQAALREGRDVWDFEPKPFVAALRKVPATHRPDFGVVPDIPADGERSFRESWNWLRGVGRPPLQRGWPWYFAVQDGMSESHVAEVALHVAGIFIGGSPPWKTRNAERFARCARDLGLRVHLARAGSIEMLKLAERIGADSADSSSWAQNASYHLVDAARTQRTLPEVTG